MNTVPRWVSGPVPGEESHHRRHSVYAEYEVPFDAGLLRSASFDSALLAAHAKVLAALSGEREVTIGYVAVKGERPVPRRMLVGPGSWRELLALTDYADEVSDAAEPPYETVLDPHGGAPADNGADGAESAVLHLSVGERTLRLRHRTDVLDTEAAGRIAGYHLTALSLMAADPDADHERQSLLSGAELAFQLDGLAGPERELPDRRVHELFEERARRPPDAVAAVHGGTEWTYRELNSRANQLGRALLARGLTREGVVAVVTERNLDWMAAVLGVLKAGGVYLPVEPHFPAERVAATLARAECAFVVTEHGSTATLDGTGTDLPRLYVDEIGAEGHADGDLDVRVGADQLAYIYFTSGSTGEPKGAMCEHAGFVNHVLAKLEDLGTGEGQVVAQTAPQCFDISLWQLVSALLVGGRTLLVGQDVILDVPRFVDTVVDGGVNVLQVVPSYLEAVLAELETRPRRLPDLHCVSVTGEAVKRELVQRWFAAQPGIRVANAYGLTETSDDTNHEVMDRVPDGPRVPLGRPVRNVRVYVVDERLAPVPLGAPGEIVFSGVCVGRGYVNDPERTAAAFTVDPFRPGERLYRSGDHGRWLPDGRLEFLGRRDTQVKLRGFRIEIGEIENALLRVPGVRDGAVVVVRGVRLVAFCTGAELVGVQERLAASLPAYMVPAAVRWRERLPLTANGKTDRRTLTALAEELDSAEDVAGEGGRRPETAGERRLVVAWAEVLGVPADRIGRLDHFFDRGGTSLSAVRLAIALDRAITLKDVISHPVLADLAELLDTSAATA
ncbi:non-ribosomal peptide synthetase [Streptomyces turgidiscabies]|uniref:Amino acid adenylation domain-containing protein n=1 Tax=Streptomyces turgidiscabies TaxID=85558 RepID=A0ABU0RZD6_9ACTN|nr:amino acid adenylation domain-containing protein [Streptomyces turgidiscabies]MDQ0937362.1 amino acid adenylation domain-containing protein [Streptomyces turgidiscabies]